MRKLPEPESQLQEVLYELLTRLHIDRKTMMLSCGVSNLTAQISNLRNKGIRIEVEEVPFTNKYNRESTFVRYSLLNKKDAADTYIHMKANQAGIPE